MQRVDDAAASVLFHDSAAATRVKLSRCLRAGKTLLDGDGLQEWLPVRLRAPAAILELPEIFVRVLAVFHLKHPLRFCAPR